ncbi:hypothetical protein ENSA5_52750 [Enhygromyxa salina]|uniref:DUF2330 domain-containing protein n=1 Tax=Enhygromyxa salina TaxID=215803 RepID=A0A2S9XG76_9BACT|nr:DUF2330 domain-containing protein [Enhygromyxa salina]PRP91837.1 hypothetical protein ENSA5_52750 [Enhygromyxa salina]
MTSSYARLLPPFTLTLGLAVTAAVTVAPSPASACGGTFCDTGPQVMPVDQSGENILFWIDEGEAEGEPHTEAHIQIQYEGDPERFAWLVPVQEVPEVLVGSQALFDNLLAGTVPTLTINTRFDGDCGSGSGIGCGVAFNEVGLAEGDDGGGGAGFGDEGEGEGPEILDRGFAGAFEYVVLSGDSVEVIVDWLDAAGYAQDPDAPPILDEYLQEGFVFVAFKLRGGTGVNEIHPLAIRYPGVEPCIPIRLTRIAATEDMAIRAFFLGQDRAVPQNWPHVELNLAKLDWLNSATADYRELVSMAIDEAGGRAFITEYAGTDAVVSSSGIDDAAWSSEAFVGVEPVEVVALLTSQGLLSCDASGVAECQYNHPQVQPILQRYLPAPEGMDEEEFWAELEANAEQIDPVAWSAQPGLVAELDERIFVPAEHALDMLGEASYLTRLYTLLSPHEMIEDPLLHETSSLGDVDNNLTATRVFSCDEGPDFMEFNDGRVVALEGFGTYPAFTDMPSAERIERVPMVGPAQVESDNAAEIDDIIDAYNRDKLVGPSPWNCSIARLRPEAMLTMLALFGLAWLQRAPRRRRT